MKINLLKNGYLHNEQIYLDFLNDNIKDSKDYFSEKYVEINDIPDFPIYLKNCKKEDYEYVIRTLIKYMVNTDRDLHLNETFWHSFLISQKRDYIIERYPQVRNSYDKFKNIVLKPFDWENYIYKCMLAAEYISDANIIDQNSISDYCGAIYENLDLYNYIIKYNIFRNSQFVVNILTIVMEDNLSKEFKRKYKTEENFEKDDRVGRKIIYEMNKNYPIIMYPLLTKEELRNEIERIHKELISKEMIVV